MPEPHERLDAAMHRRRLELRMNWREVASAAGISYEALRAIRRGDYRPAELTARALDDVLRWAHGSVYAVLDGGDPVPLDQKQGAAEAAPVAPLSPRELEVLAEMVASVAQGFDLTPEQLGAAYTRAQEIIEQRRRSRPPQAPRGGGAEAPQRGRAS